MKTVTKTFELQLDEKPTGYVLRLNDQDKCVLRICQIPKDCIVSDGLLDIMYPKTTKETTPKFIQNVDWELLREQKQTMLDMISGEEETICTGALQGIVNLLDALQDYAADDMGLGDKVVFNLEEEEE